MSTRFASLCIPERHLPLELLVRLILVYFLYLYIKKEQASSIRTRIINSLERWKRKQNLEKEQTAKTNIKDKF